jgi:beta-glucosidase
MNGHIFSARYGTILVLILCLSFLLASCQVMPSDKPKPLSSYDSQVRELLAQMTLEEKIGQMIQLDQEYLKDLRDIETYFIGSMI